MNLKRFTGTIVCFLLYLGVTPGQDAVFSQYYLSPVTLNPAFAGQNSGPNFGLMYRNQWSSVSQGVYETFLFSYDQYFKEANSGIGFQVSTDDQGDGILKTNGIDVNYAYRLRTSSDWRINLGLSVGVDQRRLDWNSLIFRDQLDPEFGAVLPGGEVIPTSEVRPDNLNQFTMDIGAGLTVYNDKHYFGFSMSHLNQPRIDFIEVNENTYGGLPIRYTLMAGTTIDLDPGSRSSRSFLTPSVMLSVQGASGQVHLGTFAGFGGFFTGLFYRHALSNPDALIGSVGFKLNAFKFAYSYDFTISEISQNSGGTHEIGLFVNLVSEEPKYLDCFQFLR